MFFWDRADGSATVGTCLPVDPRTLLVPGAGDPALSPEVGVGAREWWSGSLSPREGTSRFVLREFPPSTAHLPSLGPGNRVYPSRFALASSEAWVLNLQLTVNRRINSHTQRGLIQLLRLNIDSGLQLSRADRGCQSHWIVPNYTKGADLQGRVMELWMGLHCGLWCQSTVMWNTLL